MAEFHNVHCTNCGNVYTANQMAVNIDRIIQKDLEKRQYKNEFYRTAKELFDEICIGMYQPKFQMEQTEILHANYLKIDCKYILEFIRRKYQIEMDIDKLTSESDQEKEKNIFDSIDEDLEVSESFFDDLCSKMSLYHKVDVDEVKKRHYIERLIKLLSENPEKNILECSCVFCTVEDDKGNEFENMLKVTYFDGETESFQHMVCPNCGDTFYMDAGQYEERVIVMLGSSRVGKTAYLAALVEKLMPMYGASEFEDKIAIINSKDHKFEDFKKNVLNLYRKNKKVIKTSTTAETVPLFSLKIKIEETEKYVILTFVDLPGEVFVPLSEEEYLAGEVSGKFIINRRKICESADIFWLCLAPVQIDGRLEHRNEGASDKVELDIDMILTNIESTIRLMGRDKKNVPPTAVLVTMSDIITEEEQLYSSTFNEGLYLNMPEGTREVQFKQDSFTGLARNVKRYLTSPNVKNVVPQIQNIFHQKNFFSVAAYGIDIEEGINRDKKPYGIMLPFIWTLAVLGYIKPVEFTREEIVIRPFIRRTVEYYAESERKNLFWD